jgi:Recombination endonuclease VII
MFNRKRYNRLYYLKHRERILNLTPAQRRRKSRNHKKWAENHLDYIRKANKKWRLENPKRVKQNYRRWKNLMSSSEFAVVNKKYVLMYRYKMTPEELRKLKKKQNNKCKLCGKTPKKFVVDHDHECCPNRVSCGKCIRGLLCASCNAMLGQLDRVLRMGLKKVLDYVKSTR